MKITNKLKNDMLGTYCTNSVREIRKIIRGVPKYKDTKYLGRDDRGIRRDYMQATILCDGVGDRKLKELYHSVIYGLRFRGLYIKNRIYKSTFKPKYHEVFHYGGATIATYLFMQNHNNELQYWYGMDRSNMQIRCFSNSSLSDVIVSILDEFPELKKIAKVIGPHYS